MASVVILLRPLANSRLYAMGAIGITSCERAIAVVGFNMTFGVTCDIVTSSMGSGKFVRLPLLV